MIQYIGLHVLQYRPITSMYCMLGLYAYIMEFRLSSIAVVFSFQFKTHSYRK